MLPEVYFLRYAFSCARVLVDFRKEITEERYEELREAVLTNTPLPRELLEKIFYHAIEGMKKITSDYWNVETMREYFWNQHEAHLSPDLPPTIKRLCIVKKGKLIKKVDDYFETDLGNGDIRCLISLDPEAQLGDSVMVHYGYAVEKV